MLQSDGRMANTEIARSLDVTETTVRKRIARLLDEGLINVVAVPTPTAVGMNLSAIIGISVDLTAMHAIGDQLRGYPEVRYVGMSAGRYDVMLEAFFTDQEHLLEFVTDKLGAVEGIEKVETSIILKVVNTAAQPVETAITLDGISKIAGNARAIVLTSANPTDENSLTEPRKVQPRTEELTLAGPKFTRSFPGNSVTVLRIATKQ